MTVSDSILKTTSCTQRTLLRFQVMTERLKLFKMSCGVFKKTFIYEVYTIRVLCFDLYIIFHLFSTTLSTRCINSDNACI